LEKAWGQLDKLLTQNPIAGTIESQYALVAKVTGPYPDVRGGLVTLQAGDLWKYGTTVGNRYPAKALEAFNLQMVEQTWGTGLHVLTAEKIMLIQYATFHGQLPPGNKIFKQKFVKFLRTLWTMNHLVTLSTSR
jgi:hypothetical protein